jgi:hypothetical protein
MEFTPIILDGHAIEHLNAYKEFNDLKSRLTKIPWYVPKTYTTYLTHGIAAYALIYKVYNQIADIAGLSHEKIIHVNCDDDGFESPFLDYDIIVDDSHGIKMMRVPNDLFVDYYKTENVTFHVCENRPTPYWETNQIDHVIEVVRKLTKKAPIIPIEESTGPKESKEFKVPCIHTVMFYMLYNYNLSENKDIYKVFYASLMNIYRNIADWVSKIDDKELIKVIVPIFYINNKLFGKRNYSLNNYISFLSLKYRYLNAIKNFDEAKSIKLILDELPSPYYQGNDRPVPFDVKKSRFFE